jgi:hypothetical protein
MTSWILAGRKGEQMCMRLDFEVSVFQNFYEIEYRQEWTMHKPKLSLVSLHSTLEKRDIDIHGKTEKRSIR